MYTVSFCVKHGPLFLLQLKDIKQLFMNIVTQIFANKTSLLIIIDDSVDKVVMGVINFLLHVIRQPVCLTKVIG